MGNFNNNQALLQKGQGLRILAIKPDSPFEGKVQIFFDFIIDIIPLEESKREPKQILDKLTGQGLLNNQKKYSDFYQLIRDNEEKRVQLKIVSTKYRKVRSIQIIPNREWKDSQDLIGIQYRKQKFDQAFDTYTSITKIEGNSPILHANIKNGQYLLGCLEFKYENLNGFIQGLYDRYFDKQVDDKHVNLAIYNMLTNSVAIKPVLLKRGWGGQGLLGCQFLQGQIYKFPNNLDEKRQKMLEIELKKSQNQKVKQELKQIDGASQYLVDSLKNKRASNRKRMQKIKQIISVPLPFIPPPPIKIPNNSLSMPSSSVSSQISSPFQTVSQQINRIAYLQSRINYIDQTLGNIRNYIDQMIPEEKNEEEILLKQTLSVEKIGLKK